MNPSNDIVIPKITWVIFLVLAIFQDPGINGSLRIVLIASPSPQNQQKRCEKSGTYDGEDICTVLVVTTATTKMKRNAAQCSAKYRNAISETTRWI
jgi:hypothetical protein